jgi:hypothetical protein
MTRQNEARLREPGDRPTRAVAMLSRPDNRLTRLIARFEAVPASIRPYLLSKMFGWKVPFVGAAGIAFDELVPGRARLTLSNRRRVRNHLGGVHAAAMTLLAEAASGFVLGLSLPDERYSWPRVCRSDSCEKHKVISPPWLRCRPRRSRAFAPSSAARCSCRSELRMLRETSP